MEINYVRYDPTKNMTALVETPVDEAMYAAVSAAIVQSDPEIEQVGFLRRSEKAALSLFMAGGEFCGNATACAAEYALSSGFVSDLALLEVSGVQHLVSCRLAEQSGVHRWTVGMPLPESVRQVTLPFEGYSYSVCVVTFPGITHILLPESAMPRERAVRAIREWGSALQAEALGLLFFYEAETRITPLIYVPAADSLVWERGCGSGSAAVAVFLATRNRRDTKVTVQQPGGNIVAAANFSERIGQLTITGSVQFAGTGKINI